MNKGLFKAVRMLLWAVGLSSILAVTLLILVDRSKDTFPTRLTRADRWIEPLHNADWNTTAFRKLALTPPDWQLARWEPVPLPDTRHIPPRTDASEGTPLARTWYRLRYAVPANFPTDEGVAIFIPRIVGGAWSIYVDDTLVESNSRDWLMQWNRPVYVRLSSAGPQPGRVLDIKIGIPFRLAQGYAFGSVGIGSESQMLRAHDWRRLFQVVLPMVVLLTIILMGLWSLQFWLLRRDETQYLFMALAAIAWLIFALQYFYDIESCTWGPRWLAPFVDASISWLFLLIHLFASRADNRRHPHIEAALGVYVLMDLAMTLPVWNWHVNALLLQHWMHVGFCAFIALHISWFAFAGRQRESAVLSIALWIMVLMGAHDLIYCTGQVDPDALHLIPYGMMGVFFAFQYTNQRRYVGALLDIERSNEVLNERLADREKELARNYRRLAAAEQHQALLLERQRLMQDMHDGIGSTLMSSLVMIENGTLPVAHISSLLRECIDELRLVIHSLEPIEHDLTTLLASLRQRLGKRLEAAGIALHWHMEDLPPVKWLEAPQALQILRIVQELLTNALKHARATEIRIDSRLAPTNGQQARILLSVSDNGIGFDPAAIEHGRGLNNMQNRARRLGCSLVFQPGQVAGVKATLQIPTA